MKANGLLIFLLSLVLVLPSCKKDDISNDFTLSIVGHYTNPANATDIVVNKIDDTSVSISLETGTGSGAYSVGFSTVIMNSATAFTLNSVTQGGAVCIGTETYSGTGTHSGNNISLFLTIVGTGTGTPYDCTGTRTDNISASK